MGKKEVCKKGKGEEVTRLAIVSCSVLHTRIFLHTGGKKKGEEKKEEAERRKKRGKEIDA